MAVFEPLAYLAAISALVASSYWWAVAKVADKHESDAGRVNRRLYLAAVSTMLTLALAALCVLVLPVARLFV
ncbi:hypothetical protein KUV75_09490 [Qipengyuania gaetbuli]|uniref:hypothetical protein n=1 Tax=Qipengyuania gaetbuli TaxID=266952 RepID=UPI001C990791|nr:hypothetical protein [Qipengyuania gaetbuli]MBY6015130.1 hypothetical protein [Qipengyuania gaetbuli]